MKTIVSWCLRRRAVVALATLIILAAGAYGATQLRQQFFPDVDFPFLITNVDVRGLDAEQVDEQVAQPLEAAARNLDGVEETRTLANDGRATIITELAYGTDTEQFEEDLTRELSSVPLPPGAGELEVGGGFDEQAVLNASLSTRGSLVRLTEQAEDVQDDLEQVEGVGRVELEGGRKGEYAVELKERAVRRGETPDALAQQVRAALEKAPVGLVQREGSQTPLVVQPGTVDNERELENLPISETREVGDVATVRKRVAEGSGFARMNGRPAIALSIYTEDDANQVEVVEESERVLARAAETRPGVWVDTVFETASNVEASVSGLLLEGVLGAIFAVLVIFMFLRSVRPTLVAAVSIPTSIVFGLLAAWALGLTLNIITLAGLTIAVGRVIDDAIVVLENIYKHLERGEPRMQAALQGTSEVANAIVSSTLATAAVFLPLGVVGGLISEIFFSFSIIVVVALLASLLVAVTLIPVLGATFMRPSTEAGERTGFLARAVTPLTRFGIRPLGRMAVIGAAFAALVGTIAVVASGAIPVQFLPDSGTEQAYGTVDLPSGIDADRAEELLQPLEDRLNSIQGVESAQVTFGGAGVQTDQVEDTENGAFFANFNEDVNVAGVVTELQDWGEREYPEGFTAERVEQGPPAGQFEAIVVGEDQTAAERAAGRVTRLLEGRRDVEQIENEAANDQTQFVLEVDEDERGTRDQQRATQALAAIVRAGQAGIIGKDDVPVVVRAPDAFTEDAKALEDVPLPPLMDATAMGMGAGGAGGFPSPFPGAGAGGAPGAGQPPGGIPGGAGRPPSAAGAPPGAAGVPGAAQGGAPPTARPPGQAPSGGGSGAQPPGTPGGGASPPPPACTIDGTPGDDVLRGSAGDDVICGGGGDDTVDGGAGDDFLDGGAGDDVLRGGAGDDRLAGGPGRDRLIGGVGDDVLSGTLSEDAFSGQQGRDRIEPSGSQKGGSPASGQKGGSSGRAAAGGAGGRAPSGAAGAPPSGAAGAFPGAGAAAAGAMPPGGGPAGGGFPAGAAGAPAQGGAAPSAPGAPNPAQAAAPRPRSGGTVGDVGEVRRERAAGTRSRVDGEPAVRITGRIAGQDVNAVNQDIERQIGDLNLVGARVELGGEQEFINEMFSDLGLAIIAAVVLVYVVLVVFFGSTTQPVTILAPILFSSIGSLLALYVTRAALGLPAMIGQLLLIGIVVANSILLVDTARRLRRSGAPHDDALVGAAQLRVRPVLMTALATIAALLPLAAGLSGEGGIISRSLGAVVIGGLLTATLLTLVIVPAVSSTFDALGRRLAAALGRRSEPVPAPSDGGAPAPDPERTMQLIAAEEEDDDEPGDGRSKGGRLSRLRDRR